MATFQEMSAQVANEFLHTIAVVDDEANFSSDDTDHRLDVNSITTQFAKKGKICAVFPIGSPDEIAIASQMLSLADVSIIDWRLRIHKSIPSKDLSGPPKSDVQNPLSRPGSTEVRTETKVEESPNQKESPELSVFPPYIPSAPERDFSEVDEVENDPRGTDALKILKNIISGGFGVTNALKLIVIYTAENDLEGICTQIHDNLKVDLLSEDCKKTDFEIMDKWIRIVVYGKELLKKSDRRHEIQIRALDYSELVARIPNEFSLLANGLVPNLALKCLSVMRKQSYLLLKNFHSGLDPAFLAHRAMLPHPDDGNELLKQIITESIASILHYGKVEDVLATENTDAWIDQFLQQVDGPPRLGEHTTSWSKENLKKWQKVGFVEAAQLIHGAEKRNSIVKKEKYLHLDSIACFTPLGIDANKSEEDFSILTHHKSNWRNESYVPILTLGTIIRKIPTIQAGEQIAQIQPAVESEYFLCIQQRCDSIRLDHGEERQFVFLPLNLVSSDKGEFEILLPGNDNTYKRAKVPKEVYQICTIKFSGNSVVAFDKRVIESQPNAYVKKGSDDTSYQWICDLKDFHAQRIVQRYTSQLGRVALDESEWLRRNSP